jgi:hypothetical protein
LAGVKAGYCYLVLMLRKPVETASVGIAMVRGAELLEFGCRANDTVNTNCLGSSSSICGAGGNNVYRTSALDAVCTLILILVPPVHLQRHSTPDVRDLC